MQKRKIKDVEENIILKGIPASQGIAEGQVRIVTDKKDFLFFKEEEILVAKIIDPSYVAIMAKSQAIVTDSGGIMSHPAIVARELGIPCVVATQKATAILKNGQKIKVDGAKGIIYETK